ncbi:hypothetical protein ACP4OV_022161 [Aristida adscensionis]
MGRRKRKTLELDGGAAVSRGRPKPPVRDLDLQGTADPGEMGIVGGNSDEGRAEGDPPMEGTEGAGIVGDDSGEGRDRPAYFLACHWDWAGHPKPFSVYKVDTAGLSGASSAPSPASRRQRLYRVARLDTGVDGVVGKSFVSVRSRHRAWIVGVGGRAADTIIFDTETNAVIHGPGLRSAKHCPILAAVGDRVYALCKSPSWIKDPDFPPWFEVLDLSQARVVVTAAGRRQLEGCSWSDLPNPPCLPWKLSLMGFTTTPMVITTACVVVGSCILVSFDNPWGTLAFDTVSCEWHKVHDDPLPFAGCPALHGGSIYIGVSERNGPINGYRIRLAAASGKDRAPKLSITVMPVKLEGRGVDSGDRFCYLGNGRICSLSFVLRRFIRDPVTEDRVPRKAHLNLRTYQVDPSLLAALGETLDVNQEIPITGQWEQVFKISSSSHGFSPFAFALLSV